MDKCKYYNKHLDTIREYIACLYSLEGCCTGGHLHILLDDSNIDDDDICFCLKECLVHPEDEESSIGNLICQDFLKLSIEQRRLLTNDIFLHSEFICIFGDCKNCPIITGKNE